MIAGKGVAAAIGAAILFGAGTPLAKHLVGSVDPWLLAGVLYLASGLGLGLFRALRPAGRAWPVRADWPWLAGAVAAGGVAGPLLLMLGLAGTSGAQASLLLNAEGVFTALLAWFAFGENAGRRVVLGMVAIVAGALVLSWPDGEAAFSWPSFLVLGACLCWGIDNNLTRKVALADPVMLAAIKGLVAGSVNVALALALGASIPPLASLAGAALVGLFGYGISLVAFVVALRELGAARAGAYFSTAPFVGAAMAVPVLGEPMTASLLAAAGLMGLGVWLHLSERHEHEHHHHAQWHEHAHEHDPHHRHHGEPVAPGAHTHRHFHPDSVHSHGHAPDSHHRHDHG